MVNGASYVLVINEDERDSLCVKMRLDSLNENKGILHLLGRKLLVYALLENGFEKNLDLEIDIYGKPYFKDRRINFNISHSGNAVMCAIGFDDIGVDIQAIKDIAISKVASLFFSQEEVFVLSRDGFGKNLLSEIWCVKESYIKMLGLGLNKPMRSFTVRKYDDRYVVVEGGKVVSSALVGMIYGCYCYSICTEKNRVVEKPRILTLDHIRDL